MSEDIGFDSGASGSWDHRLVLDYSVMTFALRKIQVGHYSVVFAISALALEVRH
jgi:hypothetical protein